MVPSEHKQASLLDRKLFIYLKAPSVKKHNSTRVALGDRTTIKEFSRKLCPRTTGATAAKPEPAAKPDTEPSSGELK